MNFWFGTLLLTVELRNGIGLDIEAVDSRPVWVLNNITEELTTMAFNGMILLLPFLIITLGSVYDDYEVLK
jgi:hypothetical protein|tara:strand:+ start:72 stop:284 length:213 start_codon:yes stop_codon:yes gene_type:complete